MALNINLFGSYDQRDWVRPVAEVGEDRVLATLQAFAAAESARVRDLISFITDFGDTTQVQTNFGLAFGGELQPMTEYGPPEATREKGQWPVAYPIYGYGDRKMYTPVFLMRATLNDINRDAVGAAVKDVRTVFREILKSVLLKTNYTFNDSNWPGANLGNLTIRRLANADGSVGSIYPPGLGEITLATLNHYKTSGSGTLTAGAFDLASATLSAAGNGDNIAHIVGVNTATATSLLPEFLPLPDPRVTGVPTDQFAIVQGPRAIGRISDGDVIRLPGMPENYILSFDRSKPSPIKARESDLPGFRGFQLAVDEQRGATFNPLRPMVNRIWQRIIGFGIQNRTNGVAVQVTASGTYTDPTL
jgi:hypothetical protein